MIITATTGRRVLLATLLSLSLSLTACGDDSSDEASGSDAVADNDGRVEEDGAQSVAAADPCQLLDQALIEQQSGVAVSEPVAEEQGCIWWPAWREESADAATASSETTTADEASGAQPGELDGVGGAILVKVGSATSEFDPCDLAAYEEQGAGIEQAEQLEGLWQSAIVFLTPIVNMWTATACFEDDSVIFLTTFNDMEGDEGRALAVTLLTEAVARA